MTGKGYGIVKNLVVLTTCVILSATGPLRAGWGQGEALEGMSRAERVARAEAEARRLFAQDHYIFVTPKGRVDPAEGGIPVFALRERHWSVYRGRKHVSAYRLLRALGRDEDARRARWRKAGWGVVTAGLTLLAAASAMTVDFQDGRPWPNVGKTVGFVGGFFGAAYGQYQLARQSLPLEDLFYDVQKLNDEIWEGIHAQVRVTYGVPLQPPSVESQPER